jgi:hypothetical protein
VPVLIASWVIRIVPLCIRRHGRSSRPAAEYSLSNSRRHHDHGAVILRESIQSSSRNANRSAVRQLLIFN